MNSWTLRQQRTREIRQGYKQEHTAALRAARYVRRHAMEFHGAGVASVLAAFQVPAELAFGRCPDCSHAHVADQLCTVVMLSSLRICGCTA